MIELYLSFLTSGENYKSTIYADGDAADWKNNPTFFVIEISPYLPWEELNE